MYPKYQGKQPAWLPPMMNCTHKSNMVQNLLQPPSLNENELSSYNNLFKSKTFEQVLDFFFTLFVCLLQYVSLNGIVQEYHRLYKI